jgi:hypothetical protein
MAFAGHPVVSVERNHDWRESLLVIHIGRRCDGLSDNRDTYRLRAPASTGAPAAPSSSATTPRSAPSAPAISAPSAGSQAGGPGF